jgi:hypothetical protein
LTPPLLHASGRCGMYARGRACARCAAPPPPKSPAPRSRSAMASAVCSQPPARSLCPTSRLEPRRDRRRIHMKIEVGSSNSGSVRHDPRLRNSQLQGSQMTRFLRRRIPIPTRPVASSASEVGSGTAGPSEASIEMLSKFSPRGDDAPFKGLKS